MDETYRTRLDGLEETWQVWADIGEGLSEQDWRAATRCTGWDVAAVYAHHSGFPFGLAGPLPLPEDPAAEPVTAIEILAGFNAPEGVATSMATMVAEAALEDAAATSRRDLIDRFAVYGPRAVEHLRTAEPRQLVLWPGADAAVPLTEGLRIVLMESAVHLLDIQRALLRAPDVPGHALRETTRLLAELAPTVDFIESATGRSTHHPFPVVR